MEFTQGNSGPATGSPSLGAGDRFQSVATLLEAAIAQRAFPGAVFGVLHRGLVLALHAVGRFTFADDSPAVTTETPYDLASVSKVVATTAMTMLLWQRGSLTLDTLLGDVLPGFVIGADDSIGKRRLVTLRTLLTHSSGLPAYAPFFETCATSDEVLRAALSMPLAAQPGTVAAYSDLGFILLGKALEVLAGESLDRFCEREIFAPLGMLATRYGPLDPARVPPTEENTAFRKRVVAGEVHDENCFVMGGVCGHAGLFAPAMDVLRFADAMLQPLRTNEANTLLSAETVRLFTRRADLPPGSSRALGWDTPSGAPSSSGRYFSASSFGHLGYTGTSLWIDPVEDVAVVLLTNRTFPTRENRKIQEVRPAFHDAVTELLPGGASTRK